MTNTNGHAEALPAVSQATTAQEALAELELLCADIQHFIAHIAPRAQYRAPIIDWHHADDYAQRDITGLKKFLSAAESERQYVESLAQSLVPPRDMTSNTPHILAVWHEFKRAGWPLTSIGQAIEYGNDSAAVADSAGPSTSTSSRGAAAQASGKGQYGKQHVKGGKAKRKTRSNVKVDIVCKGGDEWVKVNTMKEARLLQEFREQDSYINSDFDSDADTTQDTSVQPDGHPQAGPSTPPPLTNSLITQARSLLLAARLVPILPGRRRPVIRIILPRLHPLSVTPSPASRVGESGGEAEVDYRAMEWQDDRTGQTLAQLVSMGIIVQLGPTPGPAIEPGPKVPLVPTRNILLDLSVLVALCCESSHMRLPTDEAEHQARFRALRIVSDDDGAMDDGQGPALKGDRHGKANGSQGRAVQSRTLDAETVLDRGHSGNGLNGNTAQARLQLGPHFNASRDLSDQLAWEAQHPLIGELRDRLSLLSPRDPSCPGAESSPKFWVTQEVYNRLPGLVDLIGGPGERARAKALFAYASSPASGSGRLDGAEKTATSGRNADFWTGSRWEGQEGVLAGLTVGILPGTDMEDDILPVGSEDGAQVEMNQAVGGVSKLDLSVDQDSTGHHCSPAKDGVLPSSSPSPSSFGTCLIDACTAILAASHTASNPASSIPAPIENGCQARTGHRPSTLSAHTTTRLPSGHTLRTLMHAASRSWTVLTNNRGAVGKVCREMGIGEGLSVGDGCGTDAQHQAVAGAQRAERSGEEAAVWIVNPSSLSEWRRREVERENERVRAVWDAIQTRQQDQ